jgi:hypothetical protein
VNPAAVSSSLGDAEIHQLDPAGFVDVDILRLDIAMDDVSRVDVTERPADIQRRRKLCADCLVAPSRDGITERFPGQQFHDDIRPPFSSP